MAEDISLGSRDWLGGRGRLLQVAAIQFLLLEREALADHYRAAPCQVPAT
jgi:hypothetical protein